jgi:hypothetical protein
MGRDGAHLEKNSTFQEDMPATHKQLSTQGSIGKMQCVSFLQVQGN